MPMNAAYLNVLRDAGQAAITHIGLVDGAGTELAGGGYARLPVTLVDDADGVIRPSADRVFTVEAGDVVGGWRAFSALTGGTNFGGHDYTGAAIKTYNNPGTYTLVAASTTITHQAG